MTPAKPIAILGEGRIRTYPYKTTHEVFSISGNNLGNLLFRYAVWLHIDEIKEYISFDFNPSEIRERYKAICIPAANFLYEANDFQDLYKRLEATSLPLVVIGLGIQAQESISEVTLRPGTQRLLSLMAERSKKIFVRGAITAEYLESRGIHNYEVLGCPSNFISPDPSLGSSILDKLPKLRKALARRVGLSPTFYDHNAALEGKIYHYFSRDIETIYVQEPYEAVAIGRGSINIPARRWLREASGFLVDLPPAEREHAASAFRSFCDVEGWIESLKWCDLLIGTRIHGVSVAWQAGIPSVLFGHDLRTRELAETMGLPLADNKSIDTDSIYDLIELCAVEYDSRRQTLSQAYRRFLQYNDLNPSPELSSLSASSLPSSTEQLETEQHDSRPTPKLTFKSFPSIRTGFIESYTSAQISGWIYEVNAVKPGILVSIEGSPPFEIESSRLREDIAERAWSFSFSLPADFLKEETLRIEVVHKQLGESLDNSPVTFSQSRECPSHVDEGQGGVLFLSVNAENTLPTVCGSVQPFDQSLNDWKNAFYTFDELAEQLGFCGRWIISPAKETALPSYLPDGYTISTERPAIWLKSMADSLALKRTQLIYPVDLLQGFPPGKMYTSLDTHWTEMAAITVAESLWDSLRNEVSFLFPGAGESWTQQVSEADLGIISSIASLEMKPTIMRQRNYLEIPMNSATRYLNARYFRSADDRAKSKLIIFHEWQGELLIEPLAEQFSKTVSLHTNIIDSEFIKREAPDVVIVQVSERFIESCPIIR